MKIDKYSAILGNTVGFHNMSTLTDHRPVASLPFGGKYQMTPSQVMAAKIPVLDGETDTASLMAYGYDPELLLFIAI